MSEVKKLKVGDRLAFRGSNYPARWHIYAIDRITPSGRIRAGHYEMNPDLSIRGRDNRWGPYAAVILTDAIAHEARRDDAIDAIKLIKPEKLSDSQLFRIIDILKEKTA